MLQRAAAPKSAAARRRPAMPYPTHLLPTTVVGSYPQPDWLVDRATLHKHGVPRTHAHDMWRIPEPLLEQAQDDATVLAMRDMERAGHRHRHRRGNPPGKLLQPVRAGAGGHRFGPARGAPLADRAGDVGAARGGQDTSARTGRSARRAVPAGERRSARPRSRCPGPSPCRSRRATNSIATRRRWRWTTPSR